MQQTCGQAPPREHIQIHITAPQRLRYWQPRDAPASTLRPSTETRDTPALNSTQLKASSTEAHILTVLKANTRLPHLSLSQHREDSIVFRERVFSRALHLLSFFRASTVTSGSPQTFFSSSCQVRRSRTAWGTTFNSPACIAMI